MIANTRYSEGLAVLNTRTMFNFLRVFELYAVICPPCTGALMCYEQDIAGTISP